MFTNNYIAFRHNLFFGTTSASGSANGVFGKNMTNTAGAATYFWSSAAKNDVKDIGSAMQRPRCRDIITGASSQASTYYGVYFGSGSTPATKADYTLESPITSGLTFSEESLEFPTDGNGKYVVSAKYAVTNTTESEINIYEIGCFCPVLKDSYNTWHLVMMDRTVLTKPITIPAGLTANVEYRFTFNQILNVE
jgi:hypothetical protein